MEPKYNFEVSGAVNKRISDVINDFMVKYYKLDKIETEWNLCINVSTSGKLKKIELFGPSRSRKYKIINYSLIAPFDLFKNKQDFLMNYISIIADSLNLIFHEFKINVENEIIFNIKNKLIDDIINFDTIS